jgi:DNA-binding MarR family transcriptional regulator
MSDTTMKNSKPAVKRGRKPATENLDDPELDPGGQPVFLGHDSFGLLLRIAMVGLRQSFKEQLASFGIPWSVWYYLRVLWDEEGLSQKELINRVGMLQPNATGAIQAMEKLGLVRTEREETDRRRIRVWLTPHARELKELLLPQVRERVEIVAFKDFTESERQQLTTLLARVCANVTATQR